MNDEPRSTLPANVTEQLNGVGRLDRLRLESSAACAPREAPAASLAAVAEDQQILQAGLRRPRP